MDEFVYFGLLIGSALAFVAFVLPILLLVRVSRLERRLAELEGRPATHPAVTPAAGTVPAPASSSPPAGSPAARPPVAPEPEARPRPVPPPPPEAVAAEAPRGPSLVARLGRQARGAFAGQEWEAVVGGSWLNKAGVLVLVIGIALFIGYSLTELGPAGRILVGLGTAAGLLALGAYAERRAGYRIVGRGLLAGGWAVLYVTAYAAHGMPAARVVESPLLGFALLLAVAAGLVAHAARYQREPVMVLAYAVAYATLLLAPRPLYATVATYPLAASLVAVALRRQWRTLGLAGMLFTYGAYLFILARDKPETVSWQALLISLGFLAAYWLIFEVGDLLALRRGAPRHWAARSLAPVNHTLWLGATAIIWQLAQPVELPWVPRGGSMIALATVFGLSAWIRTRLLPPPAGEHPERLDRRLVGGGYELSFLIAVAAVAGLAFRRFEGLGQLLVLLVEGEALWLAGWALRQPFVSRVGAVVLLGALVRGAFALWESEPLDWWGVNVTTWTPHGLALLAVAGANLLRLRRQPAVHRWEHTAYGLVGTVLVALLAWRVLPPTLVAGAWGLQALLWLEWGLHTESRLLRLQGHALAVLTFGRLFLANFTTYGTTGLVSHRLLLLVPLVAVLYWLARRTREGLAAPGVPPPQADPALARVRATEQALGLWHGYAAAIVLALLLRFELGRVAVVGGWALQSLALAYAARRLGNRHYFLQSILLALLVFARAWATNFQIANEFAGVFGRTGTGVFVTACFFAGYFIVPTTPRPSPDAAAGPPPDTAAPGWRRLRDRLWAGLERHAKAGFVLLGSALLALLSYHEVSGRVLTVVWGLEALGLLVAGFLLRQRLWRVAGLLLLLASVAKLFIHDLRELETPWRILSFVALGAMMVGVSWAYARFRHRIGPLV